MARVAVFIDGFNVYHALDFIKPVLPYLSASPFRYRKYKWLDFAKLADSYVYDKRNDQLVGTYYFTAYAKWDAGKLVRQTNFYTALRAQGVTIIPGRFKDKEVKCKTCKKKFWTREEKETDVKIE